MSPTLFCVTILPIIMLLVVAGGILLPATPRLVQYVCVLVLAYLVGSIPWGYFILQWYKGVDIRDYGSGRIGMSNVLRTSGRRGAVPVLLLDLAKGVVVVIFARYIVGAGYGEVFAGLMALVGHNWPIFLSFRGGRGIATGLGSLSVMAPVSAIIGAIVFIPITLITRYLSLGSILGVICASGSLIAMIFIGLYTLEYGIYGVTAGSIIIWQHRDNIKRLIEGTERRLGSPGTRIQ
ncbi:MAG: acyl-phosphate glycerol 3-phosphate acyltransferase [Dehalococcoidia bacterium]|nr:acyl-phosphate glycerol 3-phosphate acyltransferase [Dehalococcoidia bacterium]